MPWCASDQSRSTQAGAQRRAVADLVEDADVENLEDLALGVVVDVSPNLRIPCSLACRSSERCV